ncbi:4-alpha-glucanotransferase [Nibricoccus aquaticus]|nr:4-alpha-glucanotransferase [Nibricoccus aquaticus]
MTRLNPHKRIAGLLVPVFALRHAKDFGVGDTLAMKEAIQFCAQQGFALLQFLPIHETVGDHSPYNAISSRALSPAFVALTEQDVPGLSAEMIRTAAPESWLEKLRESTVRHNSVFPLKIHILLAAHHVFRAGEASDEELAEYSQFQRDNASWLPAYSLFRVLIREYEGNPNWTEWRPEHQSLSGANAWLARHPDRARIDHAREGFEFIQWVAWRQWRAVKAYAEENGVFLMGEMSFGVGRCSVDVWAQPELFDLEWNVGSAPIGTQDANKDSERWGQNWGLPAYRWENHRSSNFEWLRGRIASEKQFFHACRVDHLRGYFRAYMFPWPGGAKHAEFAKYTEEEVKQRTGGRVPRYVPGPDGDAAGAKMNELQGREIISVIQREAGDMHLVAEILGEPADYMKRTLEALSLANLTFPHFDRRADRSLPPIESLRKLSLVAFANHDQAPLAAQYLGMITRAKKDPEGNAAVDLKNLLELVGWTEAAPDTLNEALLEALMRTLFRTPCHLAVVMSSDLLGIAQRFNLPGSYGADTWCERLELPLSEYVRHPVYAKRVHAVARLIAECGRATNSPETKRDVILLTETALAGDR